MGVKLYIIKNKEKIIAISEYKSYIYEFITRTEFENFNNINLFKTTNKKTFNKLTSLYEDLFLEELDDIILTRKQLKKYNNFIENEKYRIKETLDNLCFILNEYDIKLSVQNLLNDTIKKLNKLLKPKKLKKILGLENLISDFHYRDQEYYRDLFNKKEILNYDKD